MSSSVYCKQTKKGKSPRPVQQERAVSLEQLMEKVYDLDEVKTLSYHKCFDKA